MDLPILHTFPGRPSIPPCLSQGDFGGDSTGGNSLWSQGADLSRPRKGGRAIAFRDARWKGETRSGFPLQARGRGLEINQKICGRPGQSLDPPQVPLIGRGTMGINRIKQSRGVYGSSPPAAASFLFISRP